MESSLLVDHEATRRLTTSKNFNSGSNSPTFSPSQSLTFEQQQNLLLLLQNQVGGGGNSGGFGFFGPSRPPPFFPNSTPPIPPQPTRSSLPPFPHFQFQSQPSRSSPLLPLPFTRSQSLPSTLTSPPVMPNRKGSGNNIQRKTKPSSGGRRKPGKDSGSNPTTYTNTPPSRPVPPITKAKVVEVEDPKEEGEIDDNEEEVVYSLSPPPSSLPLPTFTLRPRNGVGCNAEALGLSTKAGVGGGRTSEVGNGSDGSTAEDLRRLLRL